MDRRELLVRCIVERRVRVHHTQQALGFLLLTYIRRLFGDAQLALLAFFLEFAPLLVELLRLLCQLVLVSFESRLGRDDTSERGLSRSSSLRGHFTDNLRQLTLLVVQP